MSAIAAGSTSAPRLVAGHRVRPILLVIAILALAATIVGATVTQTSGWWVALGMLAPDLVPLVRFRRPEAPGRMPASMVGLYNVTHAVPGPIALAGIGILFAQTTVVIVAAAWMVHIVGDRAVGYTLRARDGSMRVRVRGASVARPHAEAGIPRR